VLNRLHDAPGGRSWLCPALLALAVYAAVLAVRLGDLSRWDHPQLRVGDEYIMATHDAYAWLAGAHGVGTGAGSPLARLARAYADLTGRPAGEFAFFAPAVAASLVAVAVALWAWTLGGVEAGPAAGFLAALAPGFYFRTRLGFYDTDMVTLFLPLAQTWMVAHWLAPHLRSPGDLFAPRRDGDEPRPASLAWPLAAGLFLRLGGADWHTQLPDFSLLAAVLAAGLVLVLGRPRSRSRLLWGLAILVLAGFHGNAGLAAALGLALLSGAASRLTDRARSSLWPGLAALALVLVLAGLGRGVADRVAGKFAVYSKARVELAGSANRSAEPGADQPVRSVAGPPPVYPGITQSVMEAQNIPLDQALSQVLPWPWLTLAGLAGFGFVAAARPVALFLLPLGLLALLSPRLGVRLTMFGGPAAALGLFLPLVWGVRRLWSARPGRLPAALLAASGLAAVLAMPLLQDYAQEPPTPIMGRAHALALEALGEFSPPDSRVWTWWDWGYATQYYARRMSFADGARHGGELLFPQALVLTTSNPLLASQVIAYSARQGYAPWREWSRSSGAEVMDFLDRLGRERLIFAPREKQYLVTPWEALRLLYWISYYGTWDLGAGQGRHGYCRELGERFRVNDRQGLFQAPGEEPVPLATLDRLGPSGPERHEFGRAGAHLVLNEVTREALLLDDLAYQSLLVQLLVSGAGDQRFADTFRLVYEGFPLVRIYEVR